MRTKILVGLMFFSLLVPVFVKAEISPELNTLCWRHKDCDDTRKKFGAVDGDGGWFQEAPCTGEWGKCLPVGKATTEIAFGGKKEFSNIGVFLTTNYNIALTIAGILAVIMIIVAGVQWVASGGNSEMITSAKKRIGGALTGLFIAYLSYTILNTINPAMVNLRMPQTFMIRPINVVKGNYCVDLEKPWKVAPVASEKDTPKDSDWIDPFVELNTEDICKESTGLFRSVNPLRDDKTKCGQKYLVKDGGGATCMGSMCDKKTNVCDHGKCVVFGEGAEGGGIGGEIKYNGTKWLEKIDLYVSCGIESFKVDNIDTSLSSEKYLFNAENIEKGVTECKAKSREVEGYFFALEIKDPGKINDVWYGGTSFCENITGEPSCGITGSNWRDINMQNFNNSLLGSAGQLIPYENAKKGFLCKLNLGNDVVMPQLGITIGGYIGSGLYEKYAPDMIKAFAPASPTLDNDRDQVISGLRDYSCPAYERAKSAWHTKLHKLRCKCHPEKC